MHSQLVYSKFDEAKCVESISLRQAPLHKRNCKILSNLGFGKSHRDQASTLHRLRFVHTVPASGAVGMQVGRFGADRDA